MRKSQCSREAILPVLTASKNERHEMSPMKGEEKVASKRGWKIFESFTTAAAQ